MDIKSKTDFVRNKILELGFNLVGFSKAQSLKDEELKLKEWLLRGYNADMNWMESSFEKRINPLNILPEAKSIISIGLNYFQNRKKIPANKAGLISVYAWGRDYHKVFEKKFKFIRKILYEIEPDSKNKFYIDYGPTMDKVWAISSGLGWMGKHTNVISTSIGSWFFIGTIITSIEFIYDSPISDMCGECRLCIDACPTDAIIDDYVLDAGKCISYHTIENKKEIPSYFKGKFESFVFGCDICQQVCPWNYKLQIETYEPDFTSNTIEFIEKKDLINMTEDEFKEKYKGRPLLRTGLKNLLRNFEFIK